MAQKAVEISVIANVNRLIQEVRRGSLATPHVLLALAMMDGRGTTLTIPLDYFMVQANRKKAKSFIGELLAIKNSPLTGSARFAEFERRYRQSWISRTPEEWGLMLILWNDIYRNEINAAEPIGSRLGDWLELSLHWWNFLKENPSFFQRMIGERVTVQPSKDWRALMVYEDQARLDLLDNLTTIATPTLIRMGLVVLAAIPITTAGWVVAVGFQSIVGLLDFLFTEWEAERDDIITDEELKEVSWSRLGIIGFDLFQLAVLGTRILMAVGDFLEFVAEAALQLGDELPERKAADEAQFDEFVASDYDEDGEPTSVFVLLDG